MKEIVKISSNLKINKNGDIKLKIEHKIAEDINDMLTKKERDLIEEHLDKIGEILAQATKRDVEETFNELETRKIREEIENCKTMEELIQLTIDLFTEGKI